MESGSLSQLIANVSFAHAAAVVAVLTIVRAVFLRNGGRTRRAAAEIIEAITMAAALLFFVIQPFVGKTFYIPSGSMLPTLTVDNHIMVDKFTPRFTLPPRGSVVVFVAPKLALEESSDDDDTAPSDAPVDYVKRIVGEPGDVILVHHGYIAINGHQVTHAQIRRVLGLSDPDNEHVKIEAGDVAVTAGGTTFYNAAQIAQRFGVPGATIEFHPGVTFRNGVALSEPYTAEDPSYDFKLVDGHAVRIDPDNAIRFDGADPDRQEMAEVQTRPPGPVPAGYVVVMGDNRNDSNDSTIWGPLEASHLVGRASSVFWPFSHMKVL